MTAGALYGGKSGTYKANTEGEFAGYTTSVIANKSIAWLKKVAKGPDPFFMAVAPKAPHVAAVSTATVASPGLTQPSFEVADPTVMMVGCRQTPAPWYLSGTFIDTLEAPRGGAYNASKELLADHHWL